MLWDRETLSCVESNYLWEGSLATNLGQHGNLWLFCYATAADNFMCVVLPCFVLYFATFARVQVFTGGSEFWGECRLLTNKCKLAPAKPCTSQRNTELCKILNIGPQCWLCDRTSALHAKYGWQLCVKDRGDGHQFVGMIYEVCAVWKWFPKYSVVCELQIIVADNSCR
jgi:hypothetical protein